MGIRLSLGRLSFGLILIVGIVCSACSPVVIIPDKALESALRAELKKPLSLVLTRRNLEQVRKLDASNLGIKNIEGLQFCIHVSELYLQNNVIRDIGQLGPLTKLVKLHLGDNQIKDIEAVSGLLALEHLDLSGAGNAITDWKHLQANVLNGGLGADAVVVVPHAHTMDNQGKPLPGFAGAYDALLQVGVNVIFRD